MYCLIGRRGEIVNTLYPWLDRPELILVLVRAAPPPRIALLMGNRPEYKSEYFLDHRMMRWSTDRRSPRSSMVPSR